MRLRPESPFPSLLPAPDAAAFPLLSLSFCDPPKCYSREPDSDADDASVGSAPWQPAGRSPSQHSGQLSHARPQRSSAHRPVDIRMLDDSDDEDDDVPFEPATSARPTVHSVHQPLHPADPRVASVSHGRRGSMEAFTAQIAAHQPPYQHARQYSSSPTTNDSDDDSDDSMDRERATTHEQERRRAREGSTQRDSAGHSSNTYQSYDRGHNAPISIQSIISGRARPPLPSIPSASPPHSASTRSSTPALPPLSTSNPPATSAPPPHVPSTFSYNPQRYLPYEHDRSRIGLEHLDRNRQEREDDHNRARRRDLSPLDHGRPSRSRGKGKERRVGHDLPSPEWEEDWSSSDDMEYRHRRSESLPPIPRLRPVSPPTPALPPAPPSAIFHERGPPSFRAPHSVSHRAPHTSLALTLPAAPAHAPSPALPLAPLPPRRSARAHAPPPPHPSQADFDFEPGFEPEFEPGPEPEAALAPVPTAGPVQGQTQEPRQRRTVREEEDPPYLPDASGNFPDPNVYLRTIANVDPDLPGRVGLHQLKDPPPGKKPNYALPTLIKFAIFGSPMQRLTLQEIYTALEERFEWYRQRSHETAWKNSIRHNLSLRKCFHRVQRPITEPGKGSYWMIDLTQGEGNKRQRKRNKKPNKRDQQAANNAPRAIGTTPAVPVAGPSRVREDSMDVDEGYGDDDLNDDDEPQRLSAPVHMPEIQPPAGVGMSRNIYLVENNNSNDTRERDPAGHDVGARRTRSTRSAQRPAPYPHTDAGTSASASGADDPSSFANSGFGPAHAGRPKQTPQMVWLPKLKSPPPIALPRHGDASTSTGGRTYREPPYNLPDIGRSTRRRPAPTITLPPMHVPDMSPPPQSRPAAAFGQSSLPVVGAGGFGRAILAAPDARREREAEADVPRARQRFVRPPPPPGMEYRHAGEGGLLVAIRTEDLQGEEGSEAQQTEDGQKRKDKGKGRARRGRDASEERDDE